MTEPERRERLLEPLKMALKLEQEGRRYFKEAADSAESLQARQTFEFLAAEENKHIERINEFYQSIKDTGGTEPAPIDTAEGTEQRLGAFNDELAKLKSEVKPTTSDIEAYRVALRFENGAEQLYARQLEETDNPHVREFFAWLIQEEGIHARVLKSCLRFAEDPAGWFKERGK